MGTHLSQIWAGDELWFLVGIQAVKNTAIAVAGWWQVVTFPDAPDGDGNFPPLFLWPFFTFQSC